MSNERERDARVEAGVRALLAARDVKVASSLKQLMLEGIYEEVRAVLAAADAAQGGEAVAWGFPNTSITGSNRWMMLRNSVPEDDQYGGALWVPLYTHPAPAPAVPASYALVPVEPTLEMLAAASREDDKAFIDGMPHGATAADVWAAMLAAVRGGQ